MAVSVTLAVVQAEASLVDCSMLTNYIASRNGYINLDINLDSLGVNIRAVRCAGDSVNLEVIAPPIAEVRLAEDVFPQDSCNEAQMSPVRILLAGPNNYRWRSYHEMLDLAGFSSQFTSSGLDCVAALRTFQPNVLVIDPNIPWGGGDGVLAVRNAEPGLKRNLVMILTSDCDASLLYRMSNYLIDDWIWQPPSPAVLQRRLERLIEFQQDALTHGESANASD